MVKLNSLNWTACTSGQIENIIKLLSEYIWQNLEVGYKDDSVGHFISLLQICPVRHVYECSYWINNHSAIGGFLILTEKICFHWKEWNTFSKFSSEAANKLLFLLHVSYKSKILTYIKDAKYATVNWVMPNTTKFGHMNLIAKWTVLKF